MENDLLKEKLIEYLEANDLKYINRGDKISHCCLNPEHPENSPSAFTLLEEGNEFTHCSSCNFHLNTENLYSLLELGIDSNILFKNSINSMLKKLEKKDKVGEQVPIYLPIFDKDFNKDYRGISAETYKMVGAFSTIDDTYYSKRIIFPIYDVEERLRGFEAVSTNKKIVPKVLRPRGIITDDIFGYENLIKSDTVFITEGLYNALSFIEVGYNGLCNFGIGNIQNKIKKLMLKDVRNVVLCGDNDTAGKNFNKECYKVLKKNFNVVYFRFPYQFKDVEKFDINDLLKNYGKAEFKKYVDKMLEKNMIKIKEN